MIQIEDKIAEEMIKNLRPIDSAVADSGREYGFVNRYSVEKDKYILQIGDPLGFEYFEDHIDNYCAVLWTLLLDPDLKGWDKILNGYEILGVGDDFTINDGHIYDNCANYRIMKHQDTGNGCTLHSWCDDENGEMVLFSADEALETISAYENLVPHCDCVIYTIHCL